MSKIKISEIFYSIQGEGMYVGVPSVFLRTFGCNLKCEGFGMPPGEKSIERKHIKFNDDKPYTTIRDLPLVKTGCDSYASWDPRFKSLSPKMELDDIVSSMLKLIPNNSWENNKTRQNTHLVITGGEPLLGWQRSYIELLDHSDMKPLNNLTFETNGTQSLIPEFKEFLCHRFLGNTTFSVSPKLSASGEDPAKAIKPGVIAEYAHIANTYLKFVADTEEHFEEINDVVTDYIKAGFFGDVYVMPTGGMQKMYQKNTRKVAELCMKYGYKYSPRLHVDIFGNEWST